MFVEETCPTSICDMLYSHPKKILVTFLGDPQLGGSGPLESRRDDFKNQPSDVYCACADVPGTRKRM